MSCWHAALKQKAIPGPAVVWVCAECGLSAPSVVEVLYMRWRNAECQYEHLRDHLEAKIAPPATASDREEVK